ncbi:hypothetical protein CYMTET_40088, partial [Cymbomonas tetramitiformis]
PYPLGAGHAGLEPVLSAGSCPVGAGAPPVCGISLPVAPFITLLPGRLCPELAGPFNGGCRLGLDPGSCGRRRDLPQACHGVGSVLPRHGPNPLAVPAAIAAVTVSDDDAVRVQDLDRASRLRGGFAALAARAPAAHLQASCATYEAMEVETLDHLRGVWEEDDMVAQQHGCGELRPAYAAELQAHGDAATPASTRGAELQAHGDAAARVHMPWGCSSPAREQHEDNRHGGGRDALARPPGSIDPPPKQSVAA